MTVKLACGFAPTATVPKLMRAGKTANLAGVNPTPTMLFVLLPPLLVNTTALLKLPEFVGAKLTWIRPLEPGRRLNAKG